MILFELNGEKQLVGDDSSIPEGATILAVDIEVQPSDFHELIDGKWSLNAERKAEAERMEAIINAGPEGRFEELQARLAELEAMVQVMAPMVELASGMSIETGLPLAES